MAVAMIYPEAPDKAGRGKKKTSQINCGVSSELVRQARTVFKHLPEVAKTVLNGDTRFNF
jgi:hypothetical protein